MASGIPGSDLVSNVATPLLPVVDRPMVQHTIEFLARIGVKRIDFILYHLPNQVEQSLGDGTRWGCEFHYHLTLNPSSLYHSIRFLDRSFSDTSIILGNADELPGSDVEAYLRLPDHPDPVAFVARNTKRISGRDLSWTGWAMIHTNLLRDLALTRSTSEFENQLLACAKRSGEVMEVYPPLSTRSASELLDTNRTLLSRQSCYRGSSRLDVNGGFRRERNARIHPSVTVIPPVYVGENAEIGSGSVVGPNVVLGRDTVVSNNCVVGDALVFPGTYVGPRLILQHSIADHSRLINARLGTVVEDVDSVLLRRLSFPEARGESRLRGRSLALILLILLSPLLFCLAVWTLLARGSRNLRAFSFVKLPSCGNPDLWKLQSLWFQADPAKGCVSPMQHFLFVFLPGLPQVLAGHIDLAGVAPRSASELLALPEDWRNLLLRSTCGLVNESVLQSGSGREPMEVVAAECFYSVQRNYRADLQMVFDYFRLVLNDLASAGSRGVKNQTTGVAES